MNELSVRPALPDDLDAVLAFWRTATEGTSISDDRAGVERLLERGVTADGTPAAAPHDPARAITRNRQPGKCCDTGCTVPGAPVMVDLPTLEQTLPSRSEPGSTL